MPTNLLQESTGLTTPKLELASATVGDVKSGRTFYAGDKTLKTGTLSLSGDAATSDVKSGKTFYSNSFTKQSGSLSLTGNATAANVQLGKTFYSDSFTKLTGTSKFAYNKMIFISGLSHYDLSLNVMYIVESENGVNKKYDIGPGGALDEPLWTASCSTITGSVCNGYFTPKVDMPRIFWIDPYIGYNNLNPDTFNAGQQYQLWGLHHTLTAVSIVIFI